MRTCTHIYTAAVKKPGYHIVEQKESAAEAGGTLCYFLTLNVI